MSRLTRSVPGRVRSGRCLAAAVLVLGATGAAQAQGNFFDFLSQTFGGGSAQPQPDSAQPDSRPLIVRAHPGHRRNALASRNHGGSSGPRGGGVKYDVVDLKGVTMYTDRTLARGDAVMTPTGIKVFNGSSSWPYTDDDFVAVASSGKMPPVVRKELTVLDSASRPELQR